MFYNNAKCDIYIGKGAGKKLMHDIDNATRSVKIISPFLAPFLIKKLIDLHNRNIHVELITTDDIEDYQGDKERNIHKLIIQQKHTNEKARLIRKRMRIVRFIVFLLVFLLAGFIAWHIYNVKEVYSIRHIILIMGISILIGWFLSIKIKNKRIFTYSYKQLFPFKVFLSPKNHYDSNTYFHSKMYIIDDNIAYLGSLNFTRSGTQNNYETRIRTTDGEAVKKIVEEFNTLFYDNNAPERNIQLWDNVYILNPLIDR